MRQKGEKLLQKSRKNVGAPRGTEISSRHSELVDDQEELSIKNFPSTRYQGSKRKIIPWIWTCLKEIDFSSALDVFGGTASVSYLLKQMGKRVTYNDYLRFNWLIGTALIENDNIRLADAEIDAAFRCSGSVQCRFVQQTFKGIYFTNDENVWIDRTIAHIGGLPNGVHSKYKKALLYYALFQSCLIKRPFNLFHRRNLYLRLTDVKREFGNKITWDKPFEEHFL